MANATADLKYIGIGQDGRVAHHPVDGGTTIYRGTLVSQLTATGQLVPTSTASSGPAIGVAMAKADNASGSDGAVRAQVESDRVFLFANGTSTNACSEATLIGSPVYAFDDHTVYDNDAAGTLKRAGYFMGMDPTGKVRVLVSSVAMGADLETGESAPLQIVAVRGASTANIANLAAFTVAGVDGLTYVAGERILLKNQSTGSQNGIYVVGTVAAGTAPLTRALDADGADEVKAGMLVHVSEGTVAADRWYFLATNAPITVGSTSLSFTQLPSYADLASTSAALGASLIGIEDSGALITASTVEGALAEHAAKFGNVTKMQIAGGTFAAGTATINTGITVTASTDAFVVMSAVVTGSSNVGCFAHLKASNVVGGAGVGAVTLNILGDDGNVDGDAAGAFRVLLIN